MEYSLSKVALATRKSKSVISRDIESGRLSARKAGSTWQIDASEAIRVYGQDFDIRRLETVPENGTEQEVERAEKTVRTAGLKADLELIRQQLENQALRDRIESQSEERQRERDQLTNTIQDLRERLDQEFSERQRLTALLMPPTPAQTPPNVPPAPVQQQPPRRSILASLFGRRSA